MINKVVQYLASDQFSPEEARIFACSFLADQRNNQVLTPDLNSIRVDEIIESVRVRLSPFLSRAENNLVSACLRREEIDLYVRELENSIKNPNV